MDLLIQPENVMPGVTVWVVITGMVVLAAVDVWRREVENYAIVALLGIAVAGMHLESIHPQQWLGGFLAATIAFAVYLQLGRRGVLGGGDVKLSVVPAFVLGACNPIVGLWWVAGTLLIHQAVFVLWTRARGTREAIPHVPAMAAGTVLAAVAFPGLL